MKNLTDIIKGQREFQRALGWPIDSISETDRNELSEKYIFKMIEEAVELRREFPSTMNPWSKHQKAADLERVKEEFGDVLLFLTNIAIVWQFTPEEILETLVKLQNNNFEKIKRRKMDILNADILKIPNKVSGVGSGSLSPKYVFIGQNPGKDITQGYKFWSNPEDGSSKVLLPILEELGILKDCYFTNLVKCTTPNNSEPDKELAMFYIEFLHKELEILRLNNSGMKTIALGSWVRGYEETDISIKHPATVLYGSVTEEAYKNYIRESLA